MNEVKVGSWVKYRSTDLPTHEWVLCTYIYLDGRMIRAIGLGKGDSFPVHMDSIVEVVKLPSIFGDWHGRSVKLWYDDKGFFLTYPKTIHGSMVETSNVFGKCRILTTAPHPHYTQKYSLCDHSEIDLGYFYQVSGATLVDSQSLRGLCNWSLDDFSDTLSKFEEKAWNWCGRTEHYFGSVLRSEISIPVLADRIDKFYNKESYFTDNFKEV